MTFAPIDFASPLTYLIAALLLALLAVPLWHIGQKKGLSAGRKTGRMTLHGLLWLALLGFVLQPRWRSQLPAGRVLLVADDVPMAIAERTRDSLKINTMIRAKAFRGATDTVVLLGQTYPEALTARLARNVVQWIPYDAPGTLQALHWKGIVRQGEYQTITGQLNVPDGQLLRLRFGQNVLDSTRLSAGNQPFRLQYPVFSQGRTSLTLWLGDTLLDTLRFVARPLSRLQVRFVLDAPDFETRALADWLGQQGHRVELSTSLSKGIGSTLALNVPEATKPTGTLPDLLITDPANAGNPLIGKALAGGKSVLILNLTRPDTDVLAIGRATGTRWLVRRVPGKDSLRVGPSLTALPYRFVPAPTMLPLGTYSAVVQPTTGRNVGGRIAVSLLTETFPLRLSGDSAAYERLWISLLAPLHPPAANNVRFDAPLLNHQSNAVWLNNPTGSGTLLRLGRDTLTLRPEPLNARSWVGRVRAAQTGWQPLADTLAGFVYPTIGHMGIGTLAQRKKIAAMVLAHRRYDTYRPATTRYAETNIPDWAWLAAVLLLLTAAWIEPKL
jgi:hypothetical protein